MIDSRSLLDQQTAAYQIAEAQQRLNAQARLGKVRDNDQSVNIAQRTKSKP